MKKSIFTYNYNNLLAQNLGNANGISLDEIKNFENEINFAYGTVFDNPCADTTAIIEALDNTDFAEIEKYAKVVRDTCENFVVLGIGGSALGANAIFRALCHFRHNELPREKRNAPRFYVEDNVDPTRLNALLDVIDLTKTIFCVVSKSGNTTETLSQFFAFQKLVENAVGEEWREHFVVVSENNNGKLNTYAEQNGLKRFFISPKLGGRYSVLSPVGLLPASVLGLDILAMVEGAKQMYNSAQNKDIRKNAPLLSATLNFLNYKHGKSISVMIPYSESLDLIGDWYGQLWAESLGRTVTQNGQEIKIGQTPIKAVGTSAQHSQFQLYLDGPSDKIVTFIGVQKFKNDIDLPSELNSLFGQNVTQNKTFADLFNIERTASTIALTSYQCPNETIMINEINENVIGKIFMFFMLKTIFIGGLMGISPYNQPAVESIKIGVKVILKSSAEVSADNTIEI